MADNDTTMAGASDIDNVSGLCGSDSETIVLRPGPGPLEALEPMARQDGDDDHGDGKEVDQSGSYERYNQQCNRSCTALVAVWSFLEG